MKKILVVDNDPLFLDFVRDLLQEAGNLVKTAEDGISALKILKTFTPDTIFVDLIMPNIDGKRLCGIIQKMERLKDSSIVILSAAATENLVEVSALGVDRIIAKGPLKNMVRDILEVVDQIKVDAPFSPSKEVVSIGDVYQRGITKELLSTKRHLESVLDRLTEGILEINPDGKIVYANRPACALTGLLEEELLGLDFFQLFSRNDRKRIQERLEKNHKENGGFTERQTVFLKENRVTVDFIGILEEEGTCIAILNNVTEQMKAETALKMSKERFRLAAESSVDLIYEWDMTSNRLEWFGDIDGALGFKNKNFPRTLEAWLSQIHPNDRTRLSQSVNAHRMSVDPIHEEYRIQRQDGAWRYWVDRAMPVLNAEGLPCKWIGACEDITERKRLEESVIQSERLAATGQLAASIAHQINSPLQGITALLSLIKDKREDDRDLLEKIRLLEGAFESIRNTVRRLLDLNRPGQEKKEQVNIHDIIRDTVALARTHLHQAGIKVHLNLYKEPIVLTASPQQLGYMFLNLINNAIEAIGGETQQPDRKRTDLPRGEITVSTDLKKDFLVMEISDSGPGIPDDALHCVFDAFYTKKGKLGMGIGLSVCDRIIKEHKGAITAGNAPESGAIFRISLPLKS